MNGIKNDTNKINNDMLNNAKRINDHYNNIYNHTIKNIQNK